MSFFAGFRWCETELKLDFNGCFDAYIEPINDYFLKQGLDHEVNYVTPSTAD